MNEDEVLESIPLEKRATSFIAAIVASVAFGIGSNSLAVGIGTFFTLLCVSSEMGSQLRFHRACQTMVSRKD
ncbi:TPA: hypothetical protein NHR53_006103 [Pseudomonas aeruginosa]|uniref:hypothetical protein n=1 Tax=Pseudomonas aeruginosa TaxID=287 RepID=UPI00111226E9|nr:hypothetical protein [Pseudomonas aeruginosa]HCE7248178.1 hypothetical protein [Pseudomonas aeruginosa]HCE8129508.1 hypothetical protein [Pseudomonas aeruginosa]HCF0447620.1 hypothetical protein [Pseudomonas aeruginosa]